jgi:hypothetical protein
LLLAAASGQPVAQWQGRARCPNRSVASNVTDHIAPDGSNNIALTADVHDVAGARAIMASPAADTAAAMERHGVLPPMTTYIEM